MTPDIPDMPPDTHGFFRMEPVRVRGCLLCAACDKIIGPLYSMTGRPEGPVRGDGCVCKYCGELLTVEQIPDTHIMTFKEEMDLPHVIWISMVKSRYNIIRWKAFLPEGMCLTNLPS